MPISYWMYLRFNKTPEEKYWVEWHHLDGTTTLDVHSLDLFVQNIQYCMSCVARSAVLLKQCAIRDYVLDTCNPCKLLSSATWQICSFKRRCGFIFRRCLTLILEIYSNRMRSPVLTSSYRRQSEMWWWIRLWKYKFCL